MQFHALPSEIAPLIKDLIDELGWHCIGVRYQPFGARELLPEEIIREIVDGPYFRVLLTPDAPTHPFDSPQQLNESIPDAVVLNIGREGPDGLDESFLSCRTYDSSIASACEQLAKRLRAITHAGARGVSPTGEEQWYAGHRYTEGARQLYERGVPIRPMAGEVRMELVDRG
jgi:hypothetical protein